MATGREREMIPLFSSPVLNREKNIREKGKARKGERSRRGKPFAQKESLEKKRFTVLRRILGRGVKRTSGYSKRVGDRLCLEGGKKEKYGRVFGLDCWCRRRNTKMNKSLWDGTFQGNSKKWKTRWE